ncbi:Uncharacterised protein [Vibrio cholerae]|nr:Uncharacterised protein [Vibrio cholerae]CSI50063.1 Uncharacterised protein [Vibrio cholerae]
MHFMSLATFLIFGLGMMTQPPLPSRLNPSFAN